MRSLVALPENRGASAEADIDLHFHAIIEVVFKKIGRTASCDFCDS